MKFYERIYLSTSIFYKGLPFESDNLGNFITTSKKYAILYALMENNGINIDPDQNGYVYKCKLKKDLNIFDADDNDDMSKLVEKLDLHDTTIDAIKHKDWLTLPKTSSIKDAVNRTIIEDALKDLGYDGYFNNEEVSGMIYDGCDNYYEVSGPGICIFDGNNIELLESYPVQNFMKMENISFEDCIEYL